MSDLQCPATILVARHGDASYVETWFSDEGGWLTAAGRQQATTLAQALAGRRISRVWTSDVSRAVQTAEIVAHHLGVGVIAHKSLREVFIGDLVGQPFDIGSLQTVTRQWFAGDLAAAFPGGESGHDVVDRWRNQLQAIADEHRGETVLVVGHQTAAGIAVPTLCRGVRPSWVQHHQLDNCSYAEMLIDADDWVLVGWPEGPADAG